MQCIIPKYLDVELGKSTMKDVIGPTDSRLEI